MKGAVYNSYTGKQCVDAAGWAAYGASWGVGDVVGVALDCDARQITFYKNNASQGIIPLSSSVNFWVPYEGNTGDYNISAVNFGQGGQTGLTYDAASGGRFKYTPPAGFKALCTANLPAPTIKNGSQYFMPVTYTGNGTGQSISSLSFQPDLLITNCRSTGRSHSFYDSVRGANLALQSDNTATDYDAAAAGGGVSAFTATGFTLGTWANGNNLNDTYVAWCWKAAGSTVSNTQGAITSAVNVNTMTGFSIVSWTGTGSASSIGHGLGATPQLIVTKRRNGAGTENWRVYHAQSNASSATGGVYLNLSNAFTTDSTLWNNTAPTSTLFNVGTDVCVNASGGTYIAYLWTEVAGFSKFGSYTGNGSADGPFVYCGFKPRFLLIKRTDGGADHWYLMDSVRSSGNMISLSLRANSNLAEESDTKADFDFLSNGFKARTGGGQNGNESGATYIFAAFAEAPFKYATAR
jgi:hypothetical protein